MAPLLKAAFLMARPHILSFLNSSADFNPQEALEYIHLPEPGSLGGGGQQRAGTGKVSALASDGPQFN